MEVSARRLIIGVIVMMAVAVVGTLVFSFTVLEGEYRESLQEKTAHIEYLEAALEGNNAALTQQREQTEMLQGHVNSEQQRIADQLTTTGICLMVEGQYNRCVKLDVATGNFIVWDAE